MLAAAPDSASRSGGTSVELCEAEERVISIIFKLPSVTETH